MHSANHPTNSLSKYDYYSTQQFADKQLAEQTVRCNKHSSGQSVEVRLDYVRSTVRAI